MTSSRAVVTINTPSDRDQVARWAKNVAWGTVVEFKKKTRSTEQNAKMHAMLAEVSDQVVWYGKKLSVEDWKNIFSASLRKAQVVPGIDPGTVVPLGIHTSTMTIDEMSNMIELIYHFGAQPEHPVQFKEPNTESSDPSPAGASDEDDAPRPEQSSSEPEGSPVPPPSGSQSSTVGKFNFGPGELQHLIDFARKALDDAAGESDPPAKEAAVDRLFMSYREVIESDDGKQAMNAMGAPLAAVINGKRSREAAADYIARELLGCPVEQLEGRK